MTTWVRIPMAPDLAATTLRRLTPTPGKGIPSSPGRRCAGWLGCKARACHPRDIVEHVSAPVPGGAHSVIGREPVRAGRRADIEGLRAVAILVVLAYHAGLGLAGGYVGVDVFFVVSGFLITGLLWNELGRCGSVSFTAFYARRARRLLPAARSEEHTSELQSR